MPYSMAARSARSLSERQAAETADRLVAAEDYDQRATTATAWATSLALPSCW